MATPDIAATTATVTGAVNAVAPGLVNYVIQHLKYPFEVGDNVKELQLATRRLVNMRDDVKIKKENEERQSGRLRNEVNGWIEEVETIEGEVGLLEQKYQTRCQCLGGFHFNCCSNYTISKRAANLLLDVKDLCSRGDTYDVVTIPAPPPSVQEVPMEPTSSSTTNLSLEQALKYINNEPTGVIDLFGMGGVGKTHLLKMINNWYGENSSNFIVIFVTASRKFSIAKLQESIVHRFDLAKNPIEEHQRNIIFNYLQVRDFILLLDNLWEGIDLERVGIPFPLGLRPEYKRKVVLTTRSTEVCGQMSVGKVITLACLKEDESLALFQKNVGSETLGSHFQIPSLAQTVVNKLGGLPLGLITIGKAMYGKKDPNQWKHAIGQLQAPSLAEDELFDGGVRVYRNLKLSYENLKTDRLKNCFLSCAMWPEDEHIEQNELIERWIGLGYIQESSIQEAYLCGHGIIGNLLAQSLLEDPYQMSGINLVKMHDVIRDMAQWIASDFGKNKNKWVIKACDFEKSKNKRVIKACDFGNSKNEWVIKAGLELENVSNNKEYRHGAECISFMENNIATLNCFATLSSLPELTSLILRSNRLQIIYFSTKTSYLIGIQFLDLSFNDLSVFPSEICELVSLQYLNLSYNRIHSIPTELKSLTNLKFFYLRNHVIRNLPEGVISQLKSLEVLDLCTNVLTNSSFSILEEINLLQNNPSLIYLLQKIPFLEETNMLQNYPSLLLEEIQRLKNLKALGITVVNLSELQKLETISIAVEIRSLIILELKNLTDLSLTSNFLWTKALKGLVDLYIGVNDLQHIVIEGNQFPNLEKLSLGDMQKLIEITWRGVLPMDVFPKLKELIIFDCNLEHITWIVHLPCLQLVHVSRCHNIKELIKSTNEDQGENTNAGRQTFPSLKIFNLIALVKLERICPDYYSFPSLGYLTVHQCPNLENLPFPNGVPPTGLQIRSHLFSQWSST